MMIRRMAENVEFYLTLMYAAFWIGFAAINTVLRCRSQ